MHWREEVDASRITIGIAPAAVYAYHPSVFARSPNSLGVKNDARGHAPRRQPRGVQLRHVRLVDVRVHTMDDSSAAYVEIPPWMPTGTTPVRYALNWGAFESANVLAIHCVHVDDEDIRSFASTTCPSARVLALNAQLGMGVAPLGEFCAPGFNVGLGPIPRRPPSRPTCSPRCASACSSTERSNVAIPRFDHHAGDRHHRRRPRAGLDDKIGSIEIGKLADLIAVDLSASRQAPGSDPVSAVVNTCSASDVLMTMVDGKTLYEKNAGTWTSKLPEHRARHRDSR